MLELPLISTDGKECWFLWYSFFWTMVSWTDICQFGSEERRGVWFKQAQKLPLKWDLVKIWVSFDPAVQKLKNKINYFWLYLNLSLLFDFSDGMSYSLFFFIAGETVVFDPEPACKTLLGPVLSSYYAKYVVPCIHRIIGPTIRSLVT